MKKTKEYYLSEDIDPMLWESVSDAYNDLSVYAYRFIAYKSDKFPIPEELIGDAVLMACEWAFKYRYSYNIEIPDPEEEMLAELVSSYGHEIVSLTNKISNKLKL